MKIFINFLVYLLFTKLIRTEKMMHMGLSKTKESSKQGVSGKVGLEHEDSSSINDVIIKISENKKKKTTDKERSSTHKSKKNSEKSKSQIPPPQAVVPDSTYQVPTSNILFKDLDTKKVQIPEKDYNELIESNKVMSKMMLEFNKNTLRSSTILRKIQNLNAPKEDSKPRDLFNIKVIEVSDDVKSSSK